MAIIVPGQSKSSAKSEDDPDYKRPRIDPESKSSPVSSSVRSRRSLTRASKTEDASSVAKRVASKNIDSALSCLEKLIDEIPDNPDCRFAEYAFMFATCSYRLPPPYNDRLNTSVIRLLTLWQHYRQRTSDTYLEDLYAFKTAPMVGFETDFEFVPHSNVYKRWRERSHPDLLTEDETRYGRWDRFLENVLDVWPTLGLHPDSPDEDRQTWSYIKRWEGRLNVTVQEMKPRLNQESFPLYHCLSLVQALAYFVLILTEYGTKMASPEDSEYICKRYYFAINRVAALYEVDVSIDTNNWWDRSMSIMQLVILSYLLQKPLNSTLEQALHKALTSDEPVPGLYDNPDDWTYWSRLDRIYGCVLGMAAWSGLIVPAETSPCVLACLHTSRNMPRNTPEPGQSSSRTKAARRSSDRMVPRQTDCKPIAEAIALKNACVEPSSACANISSDAPGTPASTSKESVSFNGSHNEGIDAGNNGNRTRDSDFQSVHESNVVANKDLNRNDSMASEQNTVENTNDDLVTEDDERENRLLTYFDSALMPARRISRFAFSSVEHISTECNALVENGIVVLPGLLQDVIANTEVYGRIVDNCDRLNQGFTLWLSNKQDIMPAESMYRSDTWDDVLLYTSVREKILPLLQSKLGPISLVKDAKGNELRTVRVCMRTDGESDDKHRDMAFYSDNLPQLNGIIFRVYTVWMLLSNDTSRSPLTFIDGSGRSHDGPINAGDVIVYNSCIQLETQPVTQGRWISVDFGVVVKDKSY